MMPRYLIGKRPQADWIDDDSPLIPSLSVNDSVPIKTGLLASNGEPIMRLPNPIGFGRDAEW